VQSETGSSMATLAAAALYPLAFCLSGTSTTPDAEPSCEARRDNTWCGTAGKTCQATAYSGTSTPGDRDGDGVPDAVDNCPDVFNPIRPEDCGDPTDPSTCKQADADGDGVGDACDPCPLVAGTSTSLCASAVDPNDLDGDGVPNAIDNCPATPNPTQADADGDGHGDACQPCPAASMDPVTLTCTTDIYAVKMIPADAAGLSQFNQEKVTVQGIVTGVATGSTKGFFLQVDPSTPGYVVDRSGLFVYFTGAPPAEGALVRVTGATVVQYKGQLELQSGSVSSTGQSPGVPAPVSALTSEVRTGGSRAAALESVLVKITDSPLTVTDAAPPLGPGDTAPSNEFVVGGTGVSDGLRVNDLFYAVSPIPAAGTPILSLQGILELRNGDSKLEPRRAADIDFGGGLSTLGPSGAFTSVGHALAPTFPAKVQLGLGMVRPVDTTVNVQASSTSLSLVGPTSTGGETVQYLIPAGSSTADVLVSGLAKDPAALLVAWTKTDLSDAKTVAVRVLDYATETPQVLSLSPSSVALASGASASLVVTMDLPVQAATSIALQTANPPDYSALVPAAIAAEQLSGTASITAGSGVGTDRIAVGDGAAGRYCDVTFTSVPACAPDVVVSGVYGGGGGTSGTFGCDYVELHNRSGQPATISGRSIQYASATSKNVNANVHPLANAAAIPGGGYYLIQEGCNASSTPQLPIAADLVDPAAGLLNLSGTAGKVFLVSTSTAIAIDGSGCPSSTAVVDWVAWGGTANCGEGGTKAPTSTSQLMVQRKDPCVDTNSSAADFAVIAVGTSTTPAWTALRDGATAPQVCSAVCGP
jgi:hypothetical protein